jgi:hypothetical protein
VVWECAGKVVEAADDRELPGAWRESNKVAAVVCLC